MAQIINTNTMSLNAQRNLSTSSSSLATSIQRLSSGMRINSAKDDAAGLAISERFTTQIRGINQAARNANDGISLAQTAEGALGEVGNNLQRIRELAVQARSATNSASDRQALNAEVQLLKQEIQRVAEQTNFNGTSLLDGSFTNQAFQIGADQGQTINISQITNANVHKLGDWTSASTPASVAGKTATGGAEAAVPTTVGPSGAFTDVTAGSTGFTFSVGGIEIYSAPAGAVVTAANIANALDQKQDALAAAGITRTGSVSSTGGPLYFSRADGNDLEIIMTGAGAGEGFANAPFIGNHSTGKPAVAADFPAITAGQLTLTKADGTGVVDINVGAAKNASERNTLLVNAINAKTHETGVTASLIDGKVQLENKEGNFTIGGSLSATALANATGLTAGSSATNGTSFAAGTAQTGFAELDISNQANADNAILAMDAALQSVNSARADLGAIQNRFTSTIANLNTNSENLSAARSRIRDVDYAQETAELTRGQILQQAGTAMLAQANQVPQNVLRLLQS
ncbi:MULTISPECIES: flagellin [Stenotrophomonas]|uniref:flagellin N-terminal helical domain-containing protein n=2 Tax=Stenotrophomonas TaxID=40323 RepID=UPI000EE1906D|nr:MULTISPECIES: flagellin [Stenotrophomonas]MBH1463092.1 flagellin [Stenotrophomonas maltophilia]MBH1850716.1 flagellin [Stenotrophomonas maltophilia]CAH0064452.1 Flagellin [Stenotrophomonas maltophilia]HCL44378.1 flagellin [Pseudomonas sp.]